VTTLATRLGATLCMAWPAGLVGFVFGPLPAMGVIGVVAATQAIRRRPVAALVAAMCAVSFSAVSARSADAAQLRALVGDVPRVEMEVVAVTDPARSRFGFRQVVRPIAVIEDGRRLEWSGPILVVNSEGPGPVQAGERASVRGPIEAAPGRVGRHIVAGSMDDPMWNSEVWAPAHVGIANSIRDRVIGHLDLTRPGEALLAGFLVGETGSVAPADLQAMRSAGLTHFVAVSGSNVAVFLALWWLALAPLAQRPRWRSGVGIVGVWLFVLIARGEPSVVRAGAMASVGLVGQIFGWAFDRWVALFGGALGCLALSGRLTADVGFGLSVAATAGVMAATSKGTSAVMRTARATLFAQAAVAPLLLFVFDSLPLLSPVANLLAAPAVGVATAVGGLGAVTGLIPLVRLGGFAASAVLWVARLAAPWPQIGPVGFVVGAAAAWVVWVYPRARPVAALLSAIGVAVAVMPVSTSTPSGTVVFLDVGQGDAALVFGTDFTVLIDGGPDPLVLADKLQRHGVRRVDLLVVSHVHADHIEGLRAVIGHVPVARVWTAFEGQSTPAAEWLTESVAAAGIPMETPAVGTSLEAGDTHLEVLGPLRRYASPNDQSLVVRVEAGGSSFLFSGDIETVAQGELGPLVADVLKVPHQGAATSEASWLRQAEATTAVVSVGPNDFGHPAAWVVETLVEAGSVVLRTDEQGDIVIRDGRLAEAHAWWRLWS